MEEMGGLPKKVTKDVNRKNGNISKGKKLFYGKSIVKYSLLEKTWKIALTYFPNLWEDITTLNLLKKGLPNAIKLGIFKTKLWMAWKCYNLDIAWYWSWYWY